MGAPGPARVTFVGHSTVLLEAAGIRILTDPFLRERFGPLRRHGHRLSPEALGPIDVVLVSHAHRDHFDPASLARLHGRPIIVVPKGVGRAVPTDGPGEVVELDHGEGKDLGRVRVEAVPARHGHLLTPMVPRSRPQGYLVRVGGALDAGPQRLPRTYFAGDTDLFPEMADLRGRVDLALLPVWVWGPVMGPGHLSPDRAARAVERIRPQWAVPIHWGTYYPAGLDRLARSRLLEPGIRFAEHTAASAPETRVFVLRPGESVSLGPDAVPAPPGERPAESAADPPPSS